MAFDIKGYTEFYFEQLDKRYAEERRHIDSVAERFPSLEKVLKGETRLFERYDELYNKYQESKPTLKDSMKPKAFYARVEEYVSELTPFVRMMEELSGKSFYYEPEQMLGSSIVTFKAAKKMKKRLEKKAAVHPTLDPDRLFAYFWATTQLEDSRIRCIYAPEWFRKNREAFDEAYLTMNQSDRNYVEHALSKWLGAGLLPGIDEIELRRHLSALQDR